MSQSMETWRISGSRPPPSGHQTSSCTTGINLIDHHGALGLSKQILECSHFWRIRLTLYWHKFQYIWGSQARDSQEFILPAGFIVVFPQFPVLLDPSLISCGNWVIVIINQLPRLSRPQFDIILHQDLIDALQGWIELKLMHSSDNSIIISILFALCSEDSSIATKPTRTRTLIIFQER